MCFGVWNAAAWLWVWLNEVCRGKLPGYTPALWVGVTG